MLMATQPALHIKTEVLPGHRIEITAPELKEGESVDVFLVVAEPADEQRKRTISEFLAALQPGPRQFKTAEEVNAYLQQERDSWDR
jgi:hypothetical protein